MRAGARTGQGGEARQRLQPQVLAGDVHDSYSLPPLGRPSQAYGTSPG